MKLSKFRFFLIVLMNMISYKSYAYDIAVENADGVTIYYNYTNDGNELIVTRGENKYVNNVVIPEEVTYMNRVRKVIAIDNESFKNCSELTSVTIPNSVTKLGYESFYKCSSLTSIDIPDSVTKIGDHAFYGCRGLTSLIIPNNVEGIGSDAFSGCSGLGSVTMGKSVKYIDYHGFYGCTNLTSVHITDLTSWCGISFFEGANPLSYAHHLYLNGKEITNLIIPNNVTTIQWHAFTGCNITSVTIPSSVTAIGDGAFSNCKNLTSVISLIENPFEIPGKSYTSRVFDLDVFNNVTLYVPKGTINKYKTTAGWKDFLFIEEGSGGDDTSTTQKCEKPTIYYQNGKLTFSCSTDGATFQSTISDADIKSYNICEVQLDVTYNISVIATKAGYENSEIATATLCWIDADPQTEGITNNVANVRAKVVLIQNNGNVLSVSGADEGTEINVYDTAGRKVGSGRATSNVTNISTTLNSGEIGIVKIGEKAVKILMK